MTDQDALDWLDGIAGGTLNLAIDNVAYDQRLQAMLQSQPPYLPPGYLSPHFTLAEFTRSDTAAMHSHSKPPPKGGPPAGGLAGAMLGTFVVRAWSCADAATWPRASTSRLRRPTWTWTRHALAVDLAGLRRRVARRK